MMLNVNKFLTKLNGAMAAHKGSAEKVIKKPTLVFVKNIYSYFSRYSIHVHSPSIGS